MQYDSLFLHFHKSFAVYGHDHHEEEMENEKHQLRSYKRLEAKALTSFKFSFVRKS